MRSEREIKGVSLKTYLPDYDGIKLPAVIKKDDEKSYSTEREILYKILFDMKSDMNDLKKLVYDLIQNGDSRAFSETDTRVIKNLFREAKVDIADAKPAEDSIIRKSREDIVDTEEIVEESLSLADKEVEMIKKALEKYSGKRKLAAHELGISERTLYRKIKEYGIEM